MIRVILGFVFIILLGLCQNSPEKETIDIDHYSSYSANNLGQSVDVYKNTSKYDSLIQNSLDLIGFPNSDIEIYTVKDFGAFSVITKNCRRRLFLYNESFFDSIYSFTGSYKAVQSVCFHEIAHHFHRHPLKSRILSKSHELEADRYSGFRLALMDASIEESTSAIRYIGNKQATSTHPALKDRIRAIKEGYYDATLRIKKDSSSIKKTDTINYEREAIASIFDSFILKNESGRVEKSNDTTDIVEVTSSLISIDKPSYLFLDKLLIEFDPGQLFDVENSEIVGKIIEPFEGSSYQLLKIESSIYRIEESTIYSISPSGEKIKVGSTINLYE